jgi:hypothetical protein
LARALDAGLVEADPVVLDTDAARVQEVERNAGGLVSALETAGRQLAADEAAVEAAYEAAKRRLEERRAALLDDMRRAKDQREEAMRARVAELQGVAQGLKDGVDSLQGLSQGRRLDRIRPLSDVRSGR